MGELLKQLLLSLLTNPAVLVPALMAVLGVILGAKTLRRRRVFWAGQKAYLSVESLKAQLREEGKDTALLDKVSEGLRLANEYMITNKWGELSDTEQAALKLQFQTLHGASKLLERQITLGKAPALALPH
jgi:hypothetical protein